MKPIWTKADSLAARREGWDIWDCAEPDGRFRLEKLDDPASCDDLDYDNPMFDDDGDAWLWVYLNAGSGLHWRAIAYLMAHSLPEYRRIVDYVLD